MADPPAVQSPSWWLDRLLAKLDADRPVLESFNNYYWGDHPAPPIPPELHQKYLLQFQELHKQSRANFMGLVVNAKANRIKVNGFRLSATEDEKADQETWKIWQASGLDSEHLLAVRSALVKGRSYLSVWEGEPYPTIAFEDACQTITENEPGNRRKRAAGLKIWVDDWTGQDRANVYLRDGIHKFKRIRPAVTDGQQIVPAAVPASGRPVKEPEWEELEDEFVENRVGIVPIVPLIPRPDDYGNGLSVLKGITPIQDRMNGFIFNQVLAGWFAAFMQKWATGVDIPVDPVSGEPMEPWSQAITRMFISEDPEASFGAFPATDLAPYIASREQEAKDIASISATPRHFLIQQGQEPSGDSLDSAEAPLLADVRNIESFLGEPLEETLRIARRFRGDADTPVDSEVVWADVRDPSVVEAKRTDAIIKQRVERIISRKFAQQKLGYTPQEMERLETELAAEALEEQAAGLTRQVMDSGTDPSRDAPSS